MPLYSTPHLQSGDVELAQFVPEDVGRSDGPSVEEEEDNQDASGDGSGTDDDDDDDGGEDG